jgi:hypothetical protein
MVTMLRYSLVVLAGCLAAHPAAAASWADALFDELSKDFGSVPRGPMLQHPFRVSNNTGHPVSIANVRVSCGCTTASALKTYLQPGEETAILARMDTTRFTGVKTVTIYVTFDRPSFEEVRLWVQANGRNDFSLTPEGFAYGTQKRGATPTATVQLTFYGSADARITEVRSDSNYIVPKAREIRREGTEVVYEVAAKLRNDAPAGKWFSDVWLKTDDPSTPPIRIPLTVEIESALSVSPEKVAMGAVKVKGESERRVIVRGARPFKITGVDGAGSDLLVRDSSPDSKPVHVLTVKLRGQHAGDVNRTLRILTDLPEDNKIEFQVNASVAP